MQYEVFKWSKKKRETKNVHVQSHCLDVNGKMYQYFLINYLFQPTEFGREDKAVLFGGNASIDDVFNCLGRNRDQWVRHHNSENSFLGTDH